MSFRAFPKRATRLLKIPCPQSLASLRSALPPSLSRSSHPNPRPQINLYGFREAIEMFAVLLFHKIFMSSTPSLSRSSHPSPRPDSHPQAARRRCLCPLRKREGARERAGRAMHRCVGRDTLRERAGRTEPGRQEERRPPTALSLSLSLSLSVSLSLSFSRIVFLFPFNLSLCCQTALKTQ